MIRLFYLLPVLAIALFAGSFLGSVDRAHADGTIVKFSPSTKYVIPGSGPFTVDVRAENVVTRNPCPWPPGTAACGLGAYNLKISFDETVIQFQSFANGPFLGSTGRTLLNCPGQGPDHDPANGVIQYHCTSSGTGGGVTPFGPTGSGVLATVTFTPLVEGTSPLVFESTTLAEIDGTPISHTNQNGSVVIAPHADLQAAKTAPGTVTAPNSITYTLDVTNLGPSTASNAMAVDSLPSGVNYVSSSPGCGYDGGTRKVTCALDSINVSQVKSVTITVSVPASSAGQSLVNTVDASSDTVDPATSNNHAQATTTVSASNMNITKTVPSSAPKGAAGQYLIVVTSTGPSTAAAVSVSDPLPSNVVHVSSSVTPPGSCGYSAMLHRVTCSLGDMAPSASATVTINVTFPNTDALVCNQATAYWTATPPGTKQSLQKCTLVGYADTDGDGCPDSVELGSNPSQGGGRDPNNPYDFYDITNMTLVIGAKDRGISGFDLNLLLLWGGTIDNGPPNSNGKDYDNDSQPNGIEDGREMDFAGVTGPAAGPDGGISGFDLNALLAQGGDVCVIPQ